MSAEFPAKEIATGLIEDEGLHPEALSIAEAIEDWAFDEGIMLTGAEADDYMEDVQHFIRTVGASVSTALDPSA